MQHLTRRAALAAFPACGLAAIVPTEAAPVDAELLSLGAEFEALFAIEEAAHIVGRETGDWSEWDAAYEKTHRIVRRIESLPATSLPGLLVKARCIQWCYGDDPVDLFDHHTTDARLTQQIVENLLSLA